MQKNLLSICAGLLVIAAFAATHLWRELRAERQATAELRTQVVAPPTVAPPAPASDSLVQEAAAQAEVPSAPAVVAPPAPEVIKAVVDSGLMASDAKTVSASRLEMLKDPEYRKARVAQLRVAQVENYPGLADELKLSQPEADQLFDLLAELQLTANMQSNALVASGADEQTTQHETQRLQQEARTRRQEALTAMLGAEKFRQWQQYQQTLPIRTQATTQFSNILAAAGQPATATQLQPLATTMVAERRRQQDELQALVREAGTMDAAAQARIQTELLSRQEQSNKRVLEAAAASLNPVQVAALRTDLEQQVVRAREALRMQQLRTTP